MFWFSGETHKGREIERFDSFEGLSRSLIKRLCKETHKPLMKQARLGDSKVKSRVKSAHSRTRP
jgi:hypothetical protein